MGALRIYFLRRFRSPCLRARVASTLYVSLLRICTPAAVGSISFRTHCIVRSCVHPNENVYQSLRNIVSKLCGTALRLNYGSKAAGSYLGESPVTKCLQKLPETSKKSTRVSVVFPVPFAIQQRLHKNCTR